MTNWFRGALLIWLSSIIIPAHITGQPSHQHSMHDGHSQMSTPLTEPGNAIFGTVQEAIRKLEADPETDWSQIDLEALRRHLIDMRNVAVFVDVSAEQDIPGGLQFRVKATSDEAKPSLGRVMNAHPYQLEQETGWTMQVNKEDTGYLVQVVTEKPDEVEKIRGLGYIGVLSYGAHHQRHHWMLIYSRNPH